MKILLKTSTALGILGCCFSTSLLASHHDREIFEPMGHHAYAQTQQLHKDYRELETLTFSVKKSAIEMASLWVIRNA